MLKSLIRLGKKLNVPGVRNILLVEGYTEIEIKRADGTVEREKRRHNTIGQDLKYAIANHLADGTVNFGVDDLFTTNAANGGAEAGNDGIIITDNSTYAYSMITTLSAGGAGSTAYATFKGVYTASGAYTTATALLGRNFVDDVTDAFGDQFASQSVAKTLATGDVLTIYWTITIN